MTLSTLYKRAKTGAIQYWQVKTVSCADYTIIVKESGKYGTQNSIVHQEIINKGKNLGKSNVTSHEEQANLQAQSDWTRKKDEGYKTLEELNITLTTVSETRRIWITDVPTGHPDFPVTSVEGKNLHVLLDFKLPKFNTDAEGQTKPMLAKPVNWDKVEYPCFVQPKLDGVRCLMIVQNSTVTMLSRSGKKYTTLGHIESDVLKAIKEGRVTGNFILDGEVYCHDMTFQEITAAVKKLRPESSKLKFRAYDTVNHCPQTERIAQLLSILADINSTNVEGVLTVSATDKEMVEALTSVFLDDGYEGSMIRFCNGFYTPGQRSSELLKVKEFKEDEFAFKNFEFGQRGVEDLIAVLWDHTGTKEFRAKVAGTLSYKQELYSRNDISEGMSFTVKYFELTDDGLPRFPVGKGFRNYE